MGNKDLESRLRKYATDLEEELREAVEKETIWSNVTSQCMSQSMGAYVQTIQEQQAHEYWPPKVKFYGEILIKLYETFPELKTVSEFYEQFPELKPEVKK